MLFPQERTAMSDKVIRSTAAVAKAREAFLEYRAITRDLFAENAALKAQLGEARGLLKGARRAPAGEAMTAALADLTDRSRGVGHLATVPLRVFSHVAPNGGRIGALL
jgi:hypothetical protein